MVPHDYKPQVDVDITGRTDEILWKKAIDEELKLLANYHVWQLVEHPDGMVPLKLKWIFRQDKNGKPAEQYKAYCQVGPGI